jgi:hypothetical protein
MNTQAVSNTLWALATLGEAMPPGPRAALLEEAVRTAPDMAAIDVSSTLLSLALLQVPLHDSLQEALLGAVQAQVPDMDAQSLANVLFAAAGFLIDQGAAMLSVEAAFNALAGKCHDLKLEGYQQVQL